VNEVDCDALMLLSDFHMDCLHNLVLGLGRSSGISGGATGRRERGLEHFDAIPNILELEA